MDPTGAVLGESLVLEAAGARVVVRPEEGGRLGSVIVAGRELLVTSDPQGLIHWGSYPMAPWAGRIRRGRFAFDGREHRLPLGMPPHAIHGVVYDRPWTVRSAGHDRDRARRPLAVPRTGRAAVRPGRGRARGGRCASRRTSRCPRSSGGTRGSGARSRAWRPGPGCDFDADEVLVRDGEGIPTGERVAPLDGPWDDAFTGVRRPPAIEWGSAFRLELESTCPWWVVYTLPRGRAVRGAAERPAGRREPGARGGRAGLAPRPRDALALDRAGRRAPEGGRYFPGTTSGGSR